MKHFITLLLMFISVQVLARDFEYTYEGQTLTYYVLDEEAKTCCTNPGNYAGSRLVTVHNIQGDLVIPEKVYDGNDEFTVIAIGFASFINNQDLRSVKIPASVSKIHSNAFLGCDKLLNVRIGISVSKIYSCAFSGCKNLSSIQIPNSVVEIEAGVFSECN